jgi:hypothetical protein
MGLPLQLFGKGSLFGPYTPLQQLDMLADQDTKSYIVGSTNSLLLQQRDRYSDILINLDEHTVNITSAALRQASVLSTPDRRWIDFLTQTVHDTWDEANPSRPKDHGFAGSEEFIRMQFEEYLLAMLSSVKYKLYMEKNTNKENNLSDIEGDPASEFHNDWVHAWMQTENFRIWNTFTDSHSSTSSTPSTPAPAAFPSKTSNAASRSTSFPFFFHPALLYTHPAHQQSLYTPHLPNPLPRCMCADPRVATRQVAEMHLNERLEKSREAIGQQLAVGHGGDARGAEKEAGGTEIGGGEGGKANP